MHAWIKINKNEIKERKKKLLVSFESSECLLKLQRRGCMEISAAFRRGFFTEEISRVFSLSCSSLGRGYPSNFGSLCLSLAQGSKSWVYIGFRM